MANTPELINNLQEFNFEGLFNELGWSSSTDKLPRSFIVDDLAYSRKQISQLSGVVVFEIESADRRIPDRTKRKRIHNEISKIAHENVLIFIDKERTQSLWIWVKREKGKSELREHDYFRGQPVDLMLSKLVRINFELEDFDESGNPPPIVEVARRLQNSLDIEKVTKKFFGDFEVHHIEFLKHIKGIEDEREKRWYGSIILNRLMFIYFLQRKSYINNDDEYLQNALTYSKAKGKDLYFRDFLWKLFFIGFAKPESQRSNEVKQILGNVPYLNGGLFLPHRLENDYQIQIDDEAFSNVFDLFERYSWNLDDTPGGKSDEINPDVLGYIFEKYINQKEFGAYYTRPDITNYLCEQTIYKLVLDRINSLAEPANHQQLSLYSTNNDRLFLQRTFDSMGDLLLNLDSYLCEKLWFEILPSLKILDPACGSGAFLVAALKTLLNIYSAIIGKMETLDDKHLRDELNRIRSEHKSLNYDIKKRIITNNIFGVDLMEEATEIAKLRLFMTLVSSVHHKDELEPLPNIDFNILAGNSLIGALKIDAESFDRTEIGKTRNLFDAQVIQSYKEILEDKNKSIEEYKNHVFKEGVNANIDQNLQLLTLRKHIETIRNDSYKKLNQILLGDFNDLKIKFEEATWDEASNKEASPIKRDLKIEDITSLQPFHWGYEFDEILNKNGGFDAIITNPPWEIFKPIAKEFCYDYDPSVERRGTNKKDFEAKLKELLKVERIRKLWLEYKNKFPYVNLYFRNSPQYINQISYIDGAKAKIDINLYKLFLEQCFNLLREDGECGIVIPSGIYSDLGSKQLREMLFNETEITGLFSFENRKVIFEGVHSRFKFVILTFRKGGQTINFPSAFMRHETKELENFPNKESLLLSVDLIKKLSPDSLSVMEFKNESEIQIAEKMLQFPPLGEKIPKTWNLVFGREFHMTDDDELFKPFQEGYLPLYEGKMIWHFTTGLSDIRHWVDENVARKKLLSSRIKSIKKFFIGRQREDEFQVEKVKPDFSFYRIAFRAITGATNERTLVATILPRQVVTGNSLNVSDAIIDTFENGSWQQSFYYTNSELIFASAMLSSFVCDWFIRNKILTNMNMFYLYQLPVPRFTQKDKAFWPIVERAAKLVCITPEFDGLAKEVGLGNHNNGVIDEIERQKLRAEIDALVAKLFDLSEAEFSYILSTFPLVSDIVKVATQNAFRDVERGLIK